MSLIGVSEFFKSSPMLLRQSGYTKIEADRLLNKSLEDLLINMPKGLADKLASNMGLELESTPSWELTPTLLTLTTLSVSLAKQISINGQKPRTSDFGDLYHAAFLPYVDIFRADSSIASAIKVARLPFKTQIVGKFADLPKYINQQLSHN